MITKDELKSEIDKLMRQYADEEIGGDTYFQKNDGVNYIRS